jgi:non-ribosomal peptide synthetase component F
LNATEDNYGVDVTLNYKSPGISETMASNVAATFEKILAETALCMHSTIGDLDCLSYRDKQQIRTWNSAQKPKYHFDCVHRVFECLAQVQPPSEPICAWDGNLTYSQLNVLASKVASQLVELGVGPGVYVPFCFEKSMWTVVATLGILKAGGAFVPLDLDHPVARTKEILLSVGARVVVVSSIYDQLLRHLVDRIVILPAETITLNEDHVNCMYSSHLVTPRDPAFILFTPGSTGRPKGIIQEHSSVVSNAFAHGKSMYYRRESRVLQFAAHTFDVAQSEYLTPGSENFLNLTIRL